MVKNVGCLAPTWALNCGAGPKFGDFVEDQFILTTDMVEFSVISFDLPVVLRKNLG